jgi:hypothetical protein
MSNTRYLEFDSSYRNRIDFPNPAEFNIEISQTGQKSRLNAVDPISLSAPLHFWNSSFDEAGATSPDNTVALNTSGTIIFSTTTAGTPSDRTIFYIKSDDIDTLRKEPGYYNGSILVISSSTPAATYYRRILDYKLISRYTDAGPPPATYDIAQVTVDSSVPDGVVFTGGFITNPTNDTGATGLLLPQVFIPSGSNINDFYTGYYIQRLNDDLTSIETRTITTYDGITHMATLDRITTGTSWVVAGSNFVIRKELPLTGTTISVSTNGLYIQLASTTNSSDDSLINSFLRMIAPLPVNGIVDAPYSQERKIIDYWALDGSMTITGGTNFTLNVGSSINDYYVGAIITDSAGTSAQVLTYNGTTKSGTLLDTLITGTFWIRTAKISSAFTAPPEGNYEILQYTRDNVVPFVYTGSLVSQQQTVCYEVELLNLILPNKLLVSGGRVAFYPYLYVELENISASGGASKGIIWSNNPSAYRMLFRVPMNDTPTPFVSPFIKIDGDGMVQTIKFKPNDSFKFAVRLNNGELFTLMNVNTLVANSDGAMVYTTIDTTGAEKPDVLVQISACFSIKRIG